MRGFTLIELLVVMVVLAVLVTIVAPRYLKQSDRAREAVLRNNLKETRDAIDKYYADHGRYPDALTQLVEERYIKAVPIDPVLERDDRWTLVSAAGRSPAASAAVQAMVQASNQANAGNDAAARPVSTPSSSGQPTGGIYDLHSGAPGKSLDGSAYASW